MPPFVIGIAGGSGAGKSTLAHGLAAAMAPAAILELDWYYRDLAHLASAARAESNFDHPDALEWALLREHLAALKRAESIQRPVYDFSTHTRTPEALELKAAPVIVVEGILALHDREVRELMDFRVFVDAPRGLRLERRILRDVMERGRSSDSVSSQFERTVEPMHQRFVAPARDLADLRADGTASVDSVVAAILAARYR